jgi:hypothetical protein
MRGCLITVTGWTIDEVEEMSFSDAIGLFDYWSDYPPVHLLVRNFLGYKPRAEAKHDAMEIGQAMRAITGRKGRAKSLDRAPAWIQQMAANSKKARPKSGAKE